MSRYYGPDGEPTETALNVSNPQTLAEMDETARDLARLERRGDRLAEALRELSVILGTSGGFVEDWEALADRYHRETGMFRPGKDAPADDETPRQIRDLNWQEWRLRRTTEAKANARALLAEEEGNG